MLGGTVVDARPAQLANPAAAPRSTRSDRGGRPISITEITQQGLRRCAARMDAVRRGRHRTAHARDLGRGPRQRPSQIDATTTAHRRTGAVGRRRDGVAGGAADRVAGPAGGIARSRCPGRRTVRVARSRQRSRFACASGDRRGAARRAGGRDSGGRRHRRQSAAQDRRVPARYPLRRARHRRAVVGALEWHAGTGEDQRVVRCRLRRKASPIRSYRIWCSTRSRPTD